MPQVPEYQSETLPQPIAGTPVTDQAPFAAFGGGDASQEAFRAAGNIADRAQDIAAKAKEQADQLATSQLDLKAQILQTNLETQTKQMLGQDALGAHEVIWPQWQKGVDQLVGETTNRQQQQRLQEFLNQRSAQLNQTVEFHVTQQAHDLGNATNLAQKKAYKDDADNNMNDPARVQTAIENQWRAIEEMGARNGWSKEQLDQAKREAQSETFESIIDRHLAQGNDNIARDYYNEHQDEILGDKKKGIEAKLEQGEITSDALKTYSQVRGMKLSDGSPDFGAMKAYILGRNDVSDKHKIEILDRVHALARQDYTDTVREEAAGYRDFLNQAYQLRKAGRPMTDALNIVNATSKDEVDAATRRDAIQKIWAPPQAQTNPSVYIDLWERVQNGTAAKTEIDSAFKRGDLQEPKWEELRKDFFKSQLGGDDSDAERKLGWQQINNYVEETFPKSQDKPKRDAFLYQLHEMESQGKNTSEIYKAAHDLLQTTPGTSGWLSSGTKQWETNKAMEETSTLAMGKLNEDLGKEVVSAIGQGALRAGARRWGVKDVNDFADAFGGYDKIKPGTKVHDAMEYLIQHKQYVTPANVKTVLEAWGKFE